MSVTAKDAVKQATGFFDELFPGAAGVRLEEVDLSEMGPWWEVTLSFIGDSPSTFESLAGKSSRSFKTVRVDAKSGDPLGIRVWKQ